MVEKQKTLQLKKKTPQLEHKKLCGWEEAEDEEEEGGGREVCYMVGMLSTLIKKKCFDHLWSLVYQSRSLVLSSNTRYTWSLVPQLHNLLFHLSCPSTTCDSSLILSLNPQSHFANPYVDSSHCSPTKARLDMSCPSIYD